MFSVLCLFQFFLLFFFCKVQEFPSTEIESKEMLAGPILRIFCEREVEFQEPVTVELPFSLREKQDIPDILDLSLFRARVLFQQSDGEQREWTEITDSLESPPSFDEAVIRFSVRHFCGYAFAFVLLKLDGVGAEGGGRGRQILSCGMFMEECQKLWLCFFVSLFLFLNFFFSFFTISFYKLVVVFF